jgi:aryl-alcohol dehydrogenase-like predicted oxidoreductase
MDETIGTFEQLVKQGKIRFYGISSIRPNVIRYWAGHSNIVSVMTQYSLLDRRPEEETLDLLHKKNIGVLVRGSVAQGLLLDKPSKPYLENSEDEVLSAANIIRSVSDNRRSPAQTAIQFVLTHPAIISAIVGIRTMQQLEEAVDTLQAPSLTNPELEQLQNSVPAHRYKLHR